MRSLHLASAVSCVFLPLVLFSQPVAAGPLVVYWLIEAMVYVPGIASWTMIGVVFGMQHKPKPPPTKRDIEGNLINDTLEAFNSSDPLHVESKRWLAERGPSAPLVAPPGVPQYNFDMCAKDMASAHMVITGPVNNNGIRVDGVPPTCMVISTVLVGNPVLGPHPTPMGSASLLYDNLTVDQYNQLKTIFDNHKTS